MVSVMSSTLASTPYEIVSVSAPGGLGYVINQQVRQWLAEDNITSVVVSKPGAQGALATSYAARQGNDRTLLMLPSGPGLWGPLTGQPGIQYDVQRDFEPIIILGTSPSVLLVPANSPYQHVSDLIKDARQRDLLWGSGHLSSKIDALRFFNLTGTSGTEVPFNGSAPAMIALSNGDFQFSFSDYGSAKSLIDAGKIRILAVTGDQRWSVIPTVPTLKEQGVNFIDHTIWYALVAKKGISDEQVLRINQILNREIRSGKKNVLTDVTNPVLGSPQDARKFIENQYRVMQPIADKIKTNN